MDEKAKSTGFISTIVERFLDARIAVILIVIALCLGAAALMVTPKEEEPQIIVPIADIIVNAPGATVKEVEQLVSTPLERLLWQIDGVEYVYSISQKEMAVVTVRFHVGEDREESLIKLYNRISMHIDQASSIVQGWVVKPVEIDDVSIVNITLYSPTRSDHELRRIGQEVLARLSRIENISKTTIHGGRDREIQVELVPEKMSGFNISFTEVEQALQGADVSVLAGNFDRNNINFMVSTSSFLTSMDEVSALVVGVNEDRPVYLREIARIADQPARANAYTHISFPHNQDLIKTPEPAPEPPGGTADKRSLKAIDPLDENQRFPAVTLAVSKKRGSNAVAVAQEIVQEFQNLEQSIIPHDVMTQITRNYGETAQEKVGGLISSLGFAILSVVILLAFTLGWREALIVAIAVPISFSLALFVNYLFGYTINRVTLFALILSLGLVVDDPITNVENIQRHIKQGVLDPFRTTLAAVDEVLPPVIMSTLAIIVCFVPLFFITGMMGPYMAPMAVNVPLTVSFSTFCALAIVPWLTLTLLKNDKDTASSIKKKKAGSDGPGRTFRWYRRIILPFLESRLKRNLLFSLVAVLLVASCLLAVFRLVPLKLLPFDNKNEFQIIVDMAEGTPLEQTDAVVQKFERYLKTVPEVTMVLSFTGTSSPMDFNGMVRHYYMRDQGNLADLRVLLKPKDQRKFQSHAIVLRLRTDLEQIAKNNNARIKLVEVPPGPPVLATLVGEIYGEPSLDHGDLVAAADHLTSIMEQEEFVVDIDTMQAAPHDQIDLIIDKEKAALHGISTRTITTTLKGAMTGLTPAMVHLSRERQPLKIRVTLPRELRSSPGDLMTLPMRTSSGATLSLGELVTIEKKPSSQPIFHKNLERVVYVLGDTAGRAPAEAVLDMQSRLEKDPMPPGTWVVWSGEGEWKITLRVFRDMGIAFAAALVAIYILLVIQSGSLSMPVLIMMAIPLTLLGILPGFLLLNLIGTSHVAGFANPVFLTATSMIGMIALGGIVIRNSLVLIEFIQEALDRGTQLKEAILTSGAIRMRPILLTALTTAIGAFPITFDPVFSGLAWALIFGLFASTLFTLVLIPVAYFSLVKQ
ncbi:MAG: efflux RND transporter permease subunit [Desulfobacterium sp.]|nr:efflux RND transporter permease subunit [Desulfobacterium sp.]